MKLKPVNPPVTCLRKKCGGVLRNITSLLAARFGVMCVQCDKCDNRYITRVAEDATLVVKK